MILLAVDYHRAVLGLRVLVHHLPHPAPELQQGVAEGVGVTGPLRVVELDHLALLPVLSQTDCPGHRQHSINNLGQKNIHPLTWSWSWPAAPPSPPWRRPRRTPPPCSWRRASTGRTSHGWSRRSWWPSRCTRPALARPSSRSRAWWTRWGPGSLCTPWAGPGSE